MTTNLRRLANTVGATPLGAVDLSSDDIALVGLSSLVEWWRADTGISSLGWKGRKADTQLSLAAGNFPAKATGGVNGKPYLMPASCQLITPVGNAFVPIGGSFSVAMVGRPAAGASGNGAVFGTYDSTTRMWAGYSGTDPNQTEILQLRGTVIGSDSNHYPNSAGVKLIIWSYSWIGATSQRVDIRVNGVNEANNAGNLSGWAADASRLCLFATNTNKSSPFAGEVYDAWAFNVPLADGSHATDLGVLETYVHNRYAIF